MVDFRKLMTPEQRERHDGRIAYHVKLVAQFKAMSDEELAERLRHTLENCDFQHRWIEGDCVYDAVLAYGLIPEIIARLERNKPKTETEPLSLP